MAFAHEKREFNSWVQALRAKILTPEQIEVLQGMVDDGQVPSLEQAAQLLDWQESTIDPDEHMYGF